ncbi:restriction endonuclease [Pseudaminobacter sp. 19-2017]|uniref:Restriction endonuclease n=1 Tax=Pseudaminobacter soli (ex Zhang et al. 2022) TaxID=2831468 RepID=A0A942E461_9HYPH|nr:restriction endonuclease [Pseudaminobacter soli]MBS3650815.1 restriction endonuclease [Pseudaminobacter soli]
MPIPDYQSLMLPVLRLAAEGEKRVADVEDRIADDLGLTAEEREELLPSGRQRVLHNRIHWAKFYMSKAGLIASPARGRFVATEAGRALLAQNPERVDVKLLLKRPEFRDFYKSSNTAGTDTDSSRGETEGRDLDSASVTPEEQIEAAYQAVVAALRADLLDRIGQNSPAFFEGLIVDLLVAMGYGGSHKSAAAQLGRSGDGGVDGVVNEDRLGLDRVYVQAKRYAATNSIGRPDVQAFVGSLVGLGATKGVFVTTSTFSPQARDFVKHLSQRVILIDGRQLADLMIEHGVGVRVSRAIEFKRLDEDFFAEE